MLFSLFCSQLAVRPDQAAWIDVTGERLSWRQLFSHVTQWQRRLKDARVGAGSIVVTQFPNGLSAVCCAIAIESLGAWESPVDVRFGDSFSKLAMERLRAHCYVGTGGIRRVLAASETVRNSQTAGSSGLILWTSGTTAEPKAVIHRWPAIIGNASGKLGAAPQTEHDRRLTVLPLSHAYARTCDFVTWLLSGGILTAVDGWLGLQQLGKQVRPTLVNAVPYLIDKILGPLDEEGREENRGDENRDEAVTQSESSIRVVRERLAELGLDQLRMLGCGGAALLPGRFQQLQRLGIAPVQGYGLTETGPVICSSSPWDARPGVVGRAIEGTEIRIASDGEIQCRGPAVMLGYWDDPVATAKRFTADQWFRTGDSGQIDSDGMLRVCGRLDEVIVLSNGYKFWPLELERRLGALPGIRHAIVRGCGTGLEAIVDAEECTSDSELLEQMRRLQSEHSGGKHPGEPRIERILRLSQPLTLAGGDLTIKSTVRRGAILGRLEASGQRNLK